MFGYKKKVEEKTKENNEKGNLKKNSGKIFIFLLKLKINEITIISYNKIINEGILAFIFI